MKRGFTLIELLMVISIISLLSSIMYASLAQAREKARDSARIQQVNQIGNAVSQYTIDKGHAPDFGGRCRAGDPNPDITVCSARSTAAPNSAQALAWNDFLADIHSYIPVTQIQSDPCVPSGCESGSGNIGEVTGFVYIAPEGIESLVCGSSCQSSTAFAEEYQLYVSLESPQNPYYGGSNNSDPYGIGFYIPPFSGSSGDTTPPSVPGNAVSNTYYDNGSYLKTKVTWSASTDTGGSGLLGYRVYRNGVFIGFTTFTYKQDLFYGIPGTSYCWSVAAIDNSGNISVQAPAPICHQMIQQQGGGGPQP